MTLYPAGMFLLDWLRAYKSRPKACPVCGELATVGDFCSEDHAQEWRHITAY